MVLEAIGAFALACNILQVVEYGAKVVGKAGSLRRGDTTAVDDAHAITQQLEKLNKDLSGSTASTPALVSPLQASLTECNLESLRLSQKFIAFVQNLRPRSSASQSNPSRVESLWTAGRLKWHQDEIEAMQNGLSQARSNLIIAFLLYMHSTQASNSSQEAILTASNHSERNMLAAIENTSDKLQSDITTLVQQMSTAKIDESTHETLFATFQASHAEVLSRLALGIDSILLEQEAARTTSKQKQAEFAQKRICSSLSFQEMESRRHQIREPHEDTFDWILNPQNTADVHIGGFRAWLDSPAPAHRLFWVSGKPGSGKSTLMQYLDQKITTSCCSRWLSGHELFICRFFLWKPGRGYQKSLQGLLQALLHQLLSAHQWLIEAVVSEGTWSIASIADSEMHWSLLELKTTIEACLHRISATKKILLLIDGLDELEGTDDDRYDMLKFVQKMTGLENVKLCVSSRPWNIFSDQFHNTPKLHLQLLTRRDIDRYVRDSLSQSMHLQSSYLHNSGDGEKLIEAIVEKASGVFLWVYLVVKELLRGFRDGETIRTLRRMVESMPADLDGFFRRIIESIDPPYRYEGSAFLQTALFSLQSDQLWWSRGLLEFTFLEAGDPDFLMMPDFDFTELDLSDLDALQYRIDLGKRRLNSRCMGLLECEDMSAIEISTKYPTCKGLQQLLFTNVGFLHRSLMDFLLTADAQKILHHCTEGPFQAQCFLCNSIVAKIVAISVRCCEELTHDESRFLKKYLSDQTKELLIAIQFSNESDAALLDVTMDRLNIAFEVLRVSDKVSSTRFYDQPAEIIELLAASGPEDLAIGVAIDYNLTSFVKEHLTSNLTTNSTDGNRRSLLLDCALHRYAPNLEIISHILRVGANPNEAITKGAPPIWWKLLAELCEIPSRWWAYPPEVVKVITMMIEHDASAVCPPTFNYIFSFTRRWKGDISSRTISLIDVLEKLKITDADRSRLRSVLRDREEAKIFNPDNLEPKKGKASNGGGSERPRILT